MLANCCKTVPANIKEATSRAPEQFREMAVTFQENEMTKRTKLLACASRMTYFIGITAVCGLWSVAQAGTIDAIYAFGDSVSEVGNIYILIRGVDARSLTILENPNTEKP